MKAPVDASKLGILTDMIDTISESDPKQLNTYKLCVDGKKSIVGYTIKSWVTLICGVTKPRLH